MDHPEHSQRQFVFFEFLRVMVSVVAKVSILWLGLYWNSVFRALACTAILLVFCQADTLQRYLLDGDAIPLIALSLKLFLLIWGFVVGGSCLLQHLKKGFQNDLREFGLPVADDKARMLVGHAGLALFSGICLFFLLASNTAVLELEH